MIKTSTKGWDWPPAKVYPAAGQCIYCGVSAQKLSKEHIMPRGLIGNTILPKSSCGTCATITGRVEQFCLRNMFGVIRSSLNFPSRHKKDDPKIPIEIQYVNGTRSLIYVKSSEYPFLLTLPKMPVARHLRELSDNGHSSVEIEPWVSFDEPSMISFAMKNNAVEVAPTVQFQLDFFSRMLAKIAHSFVAAEIGIDGFHPFLPQFILGKGRSNPNQFIGCTNEKEEESNSLYDVSILKLESKYIVVLIRLFSFLNSPTYHVVVGNKK
jgi:hypothetical protein